MDEAQAEHIKKIALKIERLARIVSSRTRDLANSDLTIIDFELAVRFLNQQKYNAMAIEIVLRDELPNMPQVEGKEA